MARTSREQVLDAVADCVVDLGVKRTTMAEIARRAGIARSTLYTHVADVDEAVAALLTRELLGLLEAALPTPQAGPARARLVTATRSVVARLSELPLLRRVLELDGELLVPYLVERLGAAQRGMLDALRALIAAGQADGSIRPGDPDRLALQVLLSAQAVTLSLRPAGAEVGREAVLDDLGELLDRYLAPGAPLAAGAPPPPTRSERSR